MPTPSASTRQTWVSREPWLSPNPDRTGLEAAGHIVLVVDDDHGVLRLTARMLRLAGYTVLEAGSGTEALRALEEETFDLVLMDVQMPEMGGLEATGHIRARERAAGGRVPIVAMTAHAMKGDRERCLGAGMDDYLSKPVQSKELFEAIARVRAAAESGPAPVRR